MAKKKNPAKVEDLFASEAAAEASNDFKGLDEVNAAAFQAESLADTSGDEADSDSLDISSDLLAAQAQAIETYLGEPNSGEAQAFAVGETPPDNIVGVAIGEKITSGHVTGEMAVQVFVKQKISASRVGSQAVDSQIDGMPTDVLEVGEVVANGYTQKYRPAPCGSSVAHFRVTAGTIGALCITNDGKLCILSNNHVLANSNDANTRDNVIQPGPADRGQNPQDLIAVLDRFIPLNYFGPNDVDAALAWAYSDRVTRRHHDYLIDPRPLAAQMYMAVRKSGRTTGHTLGQITALNAAVNVRYGSRIAQFRGQIVVRGSYGEFSRPGDSGSLVVTANSKRPVGLLFAGGSGYTFMNPIATVMARLGIERLLGDGN